MTKLGGNSFYLQCIASLFIAIPLLSQLCVAQSDSLVDCFPLAIGNRWLYEFDHIDTYDLDPGWDTKTDTGTSLYTIKGKIEDADSIVWSCTQYRVLHHREVAGSPDYQLYLDTMIIDSATFNLVELKSGRHDLYRQKNDPWNPSIFLWNSILPFEGRLPDSLRIYRYYQIDSILSGSVQIRFHYYEIIGNGSLRNDTGLVFLSDSAIVGPGIDPQVEHHRLISAIVEGVSDGQSNIIPTYFSLSQNYPNPFNPSTTIHFELPKFSHITLSIYNVLGQRIQTVVNDNRAPGVYDVVIDGTKLSSGVFFYRLTEDRFTSVRKMLYIK